MNPALTIFLTLLLAEPPFVASQFTAPNYKISGCDTRCEIDSEQDIACFNQTLNFFENTLMATMRNYIYANLNIASFLQSVGNTERPILDQYLRRAFHSMEKDKVYYRSDTEEMYSPEDATDVVTKLSEIIMNEPIPNSSSDVLCPIGCEEEKKTWLGIFLASLALNLFLVAVGIICVIITTLRANKKAASFYKNISLANEFETKKEKVK
ncbi:unnamed protein product, partial [Mesorhabditis belari]|uniref:Uncharacterized protein n=1 Tax=Mesorhabditis belari TaxID=2138241 RepID=A0AAF3EV08_9BILA